MRVDTVSITDPDRGLQNSEGWESDMKITPSSGNLQTSLANYLVNYKPLWTGPKEDMLCDYTVLLCSDPWI